MFESLLSSWHEMLVIKRTNFLTSYMPCRWMYFKIALSQLISTYTEKDRQ